MLIKHTPGNLRRMSRSLGRGSAHRSGSFFRCNRLALRCFGASASHGGEAWTTTRRRTRLDWRRTEVRCFASDAYSDPWTTLNVARGADAETVKKAYRTRALATHPDRGGDPEEFKRVTAAYDALRSGGNGRSGDGFPGGFGGGGFPGGFPSGGNGRSGGGFGSGGQEFSQAHAEAMFRDAFGDDSLLKDFQSAFEGAGTTTTTVTTNVRGEQVMRSIVETKRPDGTVERTVTERVVRSGGFPNFANGTQFQQTNLDGAKVGKLVRKVAGAVLKRAARNAVRSASRSIVGAVSRFFGRK